MAWNNPIGMGNAARAVIVADTIAALADEHGLPNSFTVGEIAAATNFRITALIAGRLISDRFSLPTIINRLATKKIKFVRARKHEGRSYVDVEAL